MIGFNDIKIIRLFYLSRSIISARLCKLDSSEPQKLHQVDLRQMCTSEVDITLAC
jgi:hypothetical protein